MKTTLSGIEKLSFQIWEDLNQNTSEVYLLQTNACKLILNFENQ